MTKRKTSKQPENSRDGEETTANRVCGVCGTNQFYTACGCTDPPMPLCGKCASSHPAAPSDHFSSSNLKLEGQSSCVLCHSASELFCCCRYPPRAICNGCMTQHLGTPPYALHVPIPRHLREKVTSPEFVETLRKRQIGMEQARTLLADNLTKIEEAENEIRGKCKWLIAAIKEEMDDAFSELWKIREDLTHVIKSALKEVEDHIYEDSYTPSNYLSSAIWNFHLLPVESELSLFSYKLDTNTTHKAVKSMISLACNIRHYSRCPGFIPIVSSTSLRKYYYQTSGMSPALALSSTVKIDTTSVWLFLDEGKIFCCGRHSPASACVYLIDPTNGHVQQLASMHYARGQQGMISYNRCVYVFGGLAQAHLQQCEAFNIDSGDWHDLPDMAVARDGLNPCVYNDSVFLVGGNSATAVELFFPQTESFSLLPFALPTGGCSVTLIDGDDMVVLQRNAVYRWKIASPETSLRETKLFGVASWSNTSPVISHNTVYILNCWTHTIGKFTLAECSFEQAVFCY